MKLKRISTLVFSLIILGIATGQEKLKVVSSASMFTDMTYQIAGSLIELKTIVPIGGDPHLHDPTPKDARIVHEADLILINGLTFEGWINELIENSGTKARVVTITDGLPPIRSDKYANSTDPHAWMDAHNGLTYIQNIYNALSDEDPDNQRNYKEKYVAYRSKIEELDQYIVEAIRGIPLDKRILITSHDAFAYYGKRYGIRLEALMGISTDAQMQTSDIQRVNRVIKTQKVPAIFVESTINPKVLKQIAQDNDIIIGGELFADSLGDEESEASTYVSMLRHNTSTIVNGLTMKTESKVVHGHDDNQKESNNNYLLYFLAAILLVGGMLLAIRTIK